MPGACLVADVAHVDALVGKARGQFFRRSEHSAAVAAHVHDESRARSEIIKHLVEVAVADAVLERRAANVAYVVVELAVFKARRHPIISAEIAAEERVAYVGGVVFLPAPVPRVVERRVKVDVAVAQFAEHIAQHLEQLVTRHPAVHLPAVPGTHLVPVESVLLGLIIEEAIVLVHYFPKRLEVAVGVVAKLFLVNARRHTGQREERQQDVKKSFHGRMLVSLKLRTKPISSMFEYV